VVLGQAGDAAALASTPDRRRGNYPHRQTGRPPLDPDVQQLIIGMAEENPTWGTSRSGRAAAAWRAGGGDRDPTTLRCQRLDPAPRRAATSWQASLRRQAAGILACDLLTVATIWLRRREVRCFIDHKTRRVHLAGVTANPDGAWVTQQARNLLVVLGEQRPRVWFLVRDRDAKSSPSFDDVVRPEAGQVPMTPVRAPRRTRPRSAGPDGGRRVPGPASRSRAAHLEQLLRVHAEHDNAPRPHRAPSLLEPPLQHAGLTAVGEDQPARVHRRDLLGGLIHEYRRAA
jgi:putative transposase